MIFTFELQRFGGGTTVHNVPAQIPEPSAEERQMQKLNLDYAQFLAPMAKEYASTANNMMRTNTPAFDYNKAMADGMAGIGAVGKGYDDLVAGKLNPEYQANMEKSIKSGVDNTLGTTMNSLAQRGVIDSKVTNKALSSQQKNISDTMAQNYMGGLGQQAQFLGQKADSLYDPLKFGSAVQNASLDVPKSYYAMATGQNAPTNDAWKTMYGARYSVATPAQSYVTQDQGFLGGLMGGLGSYLACFIAGTEILTPSGTKNIEDIVVGDTVMSLDGEMNLVYETVLEVMPNRISSDQYIEIGTLSGEQVVTTASQPFLLTDGNLVKAIDLELGDQLMTAEFPDIINVLALVESEPVWDLKVSGSNIYFANGFAVEGAK